MGYGESKSVAEEVLRDAAKQGVPVAIYRPYEVMGDQVTGACNTETAICSLFKYIADTGRLRTSRCRSTWFRSTTCPTRSSTSRRRGDHEPDVPPDQPAPREPDRHDRVHAGCRASISQVPYHEWVADLVKYVSRHPDAPTAPFVPLCVDRAKVGDMSVKEMYFEGTFPTLGRDNVERDLADTQLRCPPAELGLLNLYLNHFDAAGYITHPRRVA